uniref:Uncharacterized protein n=1 Tax=Octopus bimaculoides TaxID=37653 RepID=A0A0L8FIH8_OCTBM
MFVCFDVSVLSLQVKNETLIRLKQLIIVLYSSQYLLWSLLVITEQFL